MSVHYQRFLKVLEKWPVDKSKVGRDLGEQIRKNIKSLSNPINLTPEATETITKQIESLERLATNTYGNKFQRVYASTATGLTAEQCNQVLSSEFLQHLNEDKKIMWRKQLIKSFCTTASGQPIKPTPHIPVLCQEAISYLKPGAQHTFIDMTFGAGGHTSQLLEQHDDIKVFALDRDPVAYDLAKDMSSKYKDRLIPLFGKFSDLPHLLKDHKMGRHSIDGILFDFGCSSMQFDEADRGFSISKNGPLDMRMDRGLNQNSEQITAADVLARAEEVDLVKILRVYGEEKAAKKIARAIVEARTAFHKIETTKQLADLVASCLSDTPFRLDKMQRPTHVATKTFQALRIFVNNELNEINYGMILANEYLKPEGRLVAITFHSLEDTIVKRHLNGNVIAGLANPVPLKYCGHDVTHDKGLIESFVSTNWKQLNKHVIVPNVEEIMRNSRSRSAKLRAAVKVK